MEQTAGLKEEIPLKMLYVKDVLLQKFKKAEILSKIVFFCFSTNFEHQLLVLKGLHETFHS